MAASARPRFRASLGAASGGAWQCGDCPEIGEVPESVKGRLWCLAVSRPFTLSAFTCRSGTKPSRNRAAQTATTARTPRRGRLGELRGEAVADDWDGGNWRKT